MLAQVVYLTPRDFGIYRDAHVLPSDGAFIESVRVPANDDSWAEGRLHHHEAYRASYRNTAKRPFRIDSVHVEAMNKVFVVVEWS